VDSCNSRLRSELQGGGGSAGKKKQLSKIYTRTYPEEKPRRAQLTPKKTVPEALRKTTARKLRKLLGLLDRPRRDAAVSVQGGAKIATIKVGLRGQTQGLKTAEETVLKVLGESTNQEYREMVGLRVKKKSIQQIKTPGGGIEQLQ